MFLSSRLWWWRGLKLCLLFLNVFIIFFHNFKFDLSFRCQKVQLRSILVLKQTTPATFATSITRSITAVVRLSSTLLILLSFDFFDFFLLYLLFVLIFISYQIIKNSWVQSTWLVIIFINRVLLQERSLLKSSNTFKRCEPVIFFFCLSSKNFFSLQISKSFLLWIENHFGRSWLSFNLNT